MVLTLTAASAYLITLLFTLSLWYLLSRRRKKLPPGLPSLPLVGSLPFMGTDLLQTFHKLKKKYGDVFSFQFQGSTSVVLCSLDVIRKCHVEKGHKLNARPRGIYADILQNRGILVRRGKDLKDLRTFFLMVLRQFGGRSAIMEQRVKKEVMYQAEEIGQYDGRSFDPWRLLYCSVANVVFAIGVGSRYDSDDDEFQQLLDDFDRCAALLSPSGLLSVFPSLRYVPGDIFGYVSLKKTISKIQRVFKKHIQRQRLSFDPNDVRNLIDMFIIQQHKEGNKNREIFTDEELSSVLLEFVVAGSETTATTLYWMVLFLVLYPDVQKKLFHETVAIEEGDLTYCKRMDMPYTMAFIQEAQRLADIAPVPMPRFALDDLEVKNYVIPKGSTVMSFVTPVLNDPTLWPDPKLLNPERHIDIDGDFILRDEIISFGLGPRACVGESLASMELFFYLTGLVRRYEVLPVEGAPLPTTDADPGLTRKPKHFKVRFVQR